ncbi:MAG: hypothetical protein A2275_18690 [Bacteroidetes bacterium RIFOXYA12_FULL_35_11]|nr:MAG: hypothetical protein A2X01_18250 [Bacteroidetes bacterium GWF2_35_48]OFY72901.1 MAG: hypothetical protein A2275_18690 [Bacteroidetes bacterium RIFOXYA12_FULL_35_11]OFY95759.1 MAG: hypothetical protein A2491_08010 [Bacteroidetes bacterium RIFOXYC12_FULL_35_7]HBX52135.1 hypothetical protein [Bacteroidales bacterium]
MAQQFSQDPLYKLVFSDEFDSTALDTSKWGTKMPWWGGYSQGYGAANNITDACGNPAWNLNYNMQPPNDVSNGNRLFDTTGTGFMRQKTKHEDNPYYGLVRLESSDTAVCLSHGLTPPCSWDDTLPFYFTKAMIISKYIFTNGYFEMRYRLPDWGEGNDSINATNSYSDAFWMCGGTNICEDSALYSELDVFEQRSTDWRMDANIHYRQWDPSNNDSCGINSVSDTVQWDAKNDWVPPSTYHPYTSRYSGPYADSLEWYTIGCDWTPDYVDIYYNSNDTMRRFSDSVYPIHNLGKMYMIIDGDMNHGNYCVPYTSNDHPHYNYDIDYVRVYQVNQAHNCLSAVGNFLNTSSATYSDSLYRSLTIGGSGGSAVFNSGIHHLAAQDYVLLQEGFEVSGTGTVIISTLSCQPKQEIKRNPMSWNISKSIEKVIRKLHKNL